jgi:hypothetical protein
VQSHPEIWGEPRSVETWHSCSPISPLLHIMHTKMSPSRKSWCRQIAQRMLALCGDIQYRESCRHLAGTVYLFPLMPLLISRSRGCFCVCRGWVAASRGPSSNLKLESRGSGLLPGEGRNRSCPNTLPQHSRYLVVRTAVR